MVKLKKELHLNKIKYWIFIGLTIIWMAFIFVNSALSGNTSSGLSESVIGLMVGILKWFGDGGFILRLRDLIQSEGFHVFIRKAAHFTEFGILGVLATAGLGIFEKLRIKYIKRALLAVGFSLFYAISDEIHQLFVEGWACAVADVIIDTAGALIFSFVLTYIIIRIDGKKLYSEQEAQ